MEAEVDVVIAGYGPTGQAAASLLSRLGHRVLVLERWPSLYPYPRLCGIDGETTRIIQAAGDVDSALARSHPRHHYRIVNGEGEELLHSSWDDDVRSCGFLDRISIYQPDIEDAMDAGARARGAEVRRGWELTGLTQDADGVTATARRHRRGFEPRGTAADGELTVRSRFLIGADGARSAVAREVGATSEDLGFRDAFLSVDVLRKREIDIPPDTTITVCDPGRNVSVIPIGRDRIRFEFLVNPDDDNSELLAPEVGREFLQTLWGLTDEDVEIYRQVIYPFEGRVADAWRFERVLLAGDAAHLMPPFAGQGACSGLRDAMNLAWKLDLVLSGVCDAALLDTYAQERRPHVRAYVVRSIALADLACERDPAAAAARDERFRAGHALAPFAPPLLQTGILRRDAAGRLVPPAGELAPQGTVTRDGRRGRFDDVVGWGFVLLADGADPLSALDGDRRAFLSELGTHAVAIGHGAGEVRDDDGDYGAFLAAHGARAILVRPDFTVFGGATSLEDVPALVDELRAHLHTRARVG
jgi:3-(3-hydroxy-phenyl)propionate hydroxylase